MTILNRSSFTNQSGSEFLGLAPFLRLSIAGIDLLPIALEVKAKLEAEPENADLWMNFAIAMLCLGQRQLGLSIQAQALDMQRAYYIAAARQPAKLRLLLLMAEADLAGNTPIDCLLENSDIDLIYYYVSNESLLLEPIPEHDVLMVGIGESDENLKLLAALAAVLADWPRPVINAPEKIPATGRSRASQLLQSIPGLLISPTQRVSRSDMEQLADGRSSLGEGFDFPIILRPVGSHGGHDLDKIDSVQQLSAYLARVEAEMFYLAQFIDYCGQDGLYRKFRLALINGEAFACHMAVSANWMIHYVNAGMYEDADKIAEEADFMEHFPEFRQRHLAALQAISKLTGLEYLCLDGAETADGRLLVFEIDHAMVVHAMDPIDLFPYKQTHMSKVQHAFRDMLFRSAGNPPS